MEVILTQDVEQLGKAGERVRVRDGYSRNFLFPRKLAVPVTVGGLKFLEAKKKRADDRREKEKQSVRDLASKIEKWNCTLKVKVGEGGKLFGSVTRQDIANVLSKAGFPVDKRHIDLFDTIHQVGKYEVRLRLHPEVEMMLPVAVVEAS
jgi:large subunit ribosomal protein L9